MTGKRVDSDTALIKRVLGTCTAQRYWQLQQQIKQRTRRGLSVARERQGAKQILRQAQKELQNNDN